MTRSAQNQVDTAMALARLVQAKEENRGCRLSPEYTKALWGFISMLTQSSGGAPKEEDEVKPNQEDPGGAPGGKASEKTGNGGSLPLGADEKPAS